MRKFLSKNLSYPLLLTLISIIICLLNYTPGTYLSGWDTLHPEFNYQLNLYRTFFGVFREEQGLGALAAHAHMVEIPRIIQLWLYDLFLPQNMVRYAYIFSNLILGPLGMYYFLKNIVIKKKLPSFLGALFYLLNLGTYQTFIVPFEMFTTLYAAIPWLFLTFHNALEKLSRKNLLLFTVVLIFTIPSAYASSLWFVFMAFVGIYFSAFILSNKNKKNVFQRFLFLIALIFVVNSYWLLPNFYFALNEAKTVANANINLLFSESAFLKNKQFGTWDNILTLKTFYFDWGIYDYKTQSFIQLAQALHSHFANTLIKTLGWLVAGLFLSGIALSFKSYSKFSIALIASILFSLIFLVNDNPPLSPVFNFIQENVPLFKEALRFPNNKIINIFTFIFTIYLTLSINQILNYLDKFRFKNISKKIFAVAISLILIIYMLPVFRGNMINPNMRINIPDEYFEAFNYLGNENVGRIANFPVHSLWGWTYYNWHGEKPSFQGAGFLYFGIPQSILDRDFDRWSKYNEQYYREVSQAVYSKDIKQLKEVLLKYNITHIFLDKSIIAPGQDNRTLYYEQTEEMLRELINEGFILEASTFGDFLSIYRVNNVDRSYVKSLKSSITANAYLGSYYKDAIFSENENYISKNANNNLDYPFNSLLNNESRVNKDILSFENNKIEFLLDKLYSITNAHYNQKAIPATAIVDLSPGKLLLSLYPSTPQFDNMSIIQPIQGEFDLNSKNGAFLSINNNAFPLSDISDNTPVVIGSVFLSNQSNYLSVYENLQQRFSHRLSDASISFSRCLTQDNTNLDIFVRPNSLSFINDSDHDLCIFTPLNFLQNDSYDSQNILLRLTFTTKSDTSSFSACLADMNSNKCVESITKITRGSSVTFYTSLNTNDLDKKQIVIIASSQENSEIGIQDVNINTYEASSESFLDSSFFTTSIQKANFSTISIPLFNEKGYFFRPNNNNSLDNKCDSSLNQQSKQLIKTYDNSLGVFKYTSSEGSFCDSISFENLPHNLSYLVVIKSSNIKGLPMTICMTNHTSRRCDIYSKLSEGSSINEDIFYLPASDVNATGYDVNIENFGLSLSPSENELHSISFIPIPFDIFSTIKYGSSEKITFDGSISGINYHTPSLTSFSLKGNSTLISNNYSHNKGFELYKIECGNTISCTLFSFLSPIFGEKENNKVLGNSWNNSWIIEDIDEKYSYVIVFLPQYLQYLGYVLFTGGLITILFWQKVYKRLSIKN